jgi:hypothetical protein
MKHITGIVNSYLRKKTQHALQLVGPWGKGKTHFYKNELEPILREVPTFAKGSHNYKPVYISLFGLSSVEEVQIKIFYELLYSRLQAKTGAGKTTLRMSSRLTKLVLSGYLTFKGIKGSKDLIAEVTDVARNLIDTGDLFICFDDLERKSTKLNIEDLIGYINMLTEENVKVLVIANEDKITESNYKDFKQKVIGVTLVYHPNPSFVIDQIITARYTGFPQFTNFIKELKPLLVEVVAKNQDNYRLLIYGMDNLHDVYSAIRNDILDQNKVIAAKCNDKLSEISKYVLTHSMEYKQSIITYADKEAMKNMNGTLYSILEGYRNDASEKVPEDASKAESFIAKYYENKHEYKFYESIFSFVTGAQTFDVQEFGKEFARHFNLEKGKILQEYKVAEELGYSQVFDLSDNAYREKTYQMIDFAKKGLYKLVDYLMVYHYASRFDNLLELNLDALREDLLEALDKLAEDEAFLESDLTPQIQLENSVTADPNMEAIRSKALQILSINRERRKQKKLESTTITFEKDLENLETRYHTDTDFKIAVTQGPILAELNTDKLLDQLLTRSPSSTRMLTAILHSRYMRPESFRSEKTFAKEVLRKIQNHLEEDGPRTLRNWVLRELRDELVRSCAKFEEIIEASEDGEPEE